MSSDSPQTVTLENFGDAALNAVAPGIAAPSDFLQVTGNEADCSATFSLTASASCTLRIEFDPATIGSKSESFAVTDNNLNSSSTTQTIGVSGLAAPAVSVVISPGSLTAPVIGSSYSQTLTASGGTSPYTFTVISGSLPAGLSLNSGGVLSGTPTAVGTFTFTVQAQDSTSGGSGGPYTGTLSFTVIIAAPTVVVSPSTLPNGTYGSSYSQGISASGGSGTYSYAVSSGSLPSGLSLNSSTGALTGTPTAAGSATFTVTATDTVTTGPAAPYTGSQIYTLVVSKAAATVTLSNLTQTYTGSALTPTATTTPTGLSVTWSGRAGHRRRQLPGDGDHQRSELRRLGQRHLRDQQGRGDGDAEQPDPDLYRLGADADGDDDSFRAERDLERRRRTPPRAAIR